MTDHNDWDFEPSGENMPSVPELFADVMYFLASVLIALIRIAIPVGIIVFFGWLLIKLTIFLMGV